MVSNTCQNNPLDFNLDLLKTDAPPAPPPTTSTTTTTSTSTTTTTTIPTFNLSVAGTVQGWCSDMPIESTPDLGFGSITANGPFQTTNHAVVSGTVVQIQITGGVRVDWSNCAAVANEVCTVTMTSDRCANCTLPSPTAAVFGDCTGATTGAGRGRYGKQ